MRRAGIRWGSRCRRWCDFVVQALAWFVVPALAGSRCNASSKLIIVPPLAIIQNGIRVPRTRCLLATKVLEILVGTGPGPILPLLDVFMFHRVMMDIVDRRHQVSIA